MSRVDGEEELRRLLRDGVPRLAAPEDRIARVRARVVRGRRRRAAVTGAAVCVAAVLAVARPWAGAGSPTPEDTAYPAVLPRLATAVTVGRAPVSPDGAAVFPFRETRVGAILPAAWRAEMVPGPGYSVGYAARQPLGPAKPCANPAIGAFTCVPLLHRLTSPGAAVAFFADGSPENGTPVKELRAPYQGGLRLSAPKAPAADCRAIGGDREMIAVNSAGGLSPAVAYVCVRGTAGTASDEVARVIASAAFTSTPAASPGP